ncbi:MAG TPA: pyruvate dehydrogenase complex dihydrolipoamide acetyltransferase [Kofleriaceae bacterium]|nr:pyruvate dehydrogenase complex dihydrolipoamide acetyltransferase [Kofleriaceae bacterium]
MAQIIGLPKLSPTMEEGVLVRWTKKEGDKVSPGDLVAEVETDKANMDFNIEDDGVLLKLLVKEGDTVKLGAPVAIIGKAGEDVSALVEQAKSQGGGGGDGKAAAPKPEPKAAAKPEPKQKPDVRGVEDSANAPAARKEPREATKPEQRAADPQVGAKAAQTAKQAKAAPKQEARPSGRVLASPLAKSLAIELGIDLRNVEGTGPGGRIVERDVRAAADGAAPAGQQTNGHARDDDHEQADAGDTTEHETTQAIAVRRAPAVVPADAGDEYEDIPASNMRRRIAARLTEAKRDVPHFYLQRQLDAAPLLAFRERLNALLGAKETSPGGGSRQENPRQVGKVSVNDLVIKAVALALRRMPECNAAWEGDVIRRFHRVHIGVAVAIEDGLVTPVVRDADLKGLGAIASEVKDLAERAKKRGLKGHEITGSTFTVSNLGMFGIERFTAILNPPEAGILAIGAVLDVPVVQNGQVVAGKRMTVSMSCDHRVIDGALGARWLQVFAELIEKPESLAL